MVAELPFGHLCARILVDSEIARGFVGIVCALDGTEGSLHANIAVFVLNVAVVGNAPDYEYHRPDPQNAEQKDHAYDDQDDLEALLP